MAILAVHVSNLFEYGSYLEMEESLLREFLIDKNIDVTDLNNFITKEEYSNIYEVLADKADHSHFGLNFGCYLNIKSLGFIAEISLNATNIEQAIFVLQQYLKSAFSIVSLNVINENDNVILVLNSDCEPIKFKMQLLDTVFCFMYRELKLMLGDDLSPILKLPYISKDEYETLLYTEIGYADTHQLILKKEVLTAPINVKRAKEIEYLLPKLMQLLAAQDEKYGAFSLKVRNMVLNMCSPEPPSFNQVVQQFALSERTFQRKLLEEGFSYRKIVDDIKKDLSSYLKKGKLMKTKEIASILGYTQASNYLHAVKRWEGSV